MSLNMPQMESETSKIVGEDTEKSKNKKYVIAGIGCGCLVFVILFMVAIVLMYYYSKTISKIYTDDRVVSKSLLPKDKEIEDVDDDEVGEKVNNDSSDDSKLNEENDEEERELDKNDNEKSKCFGIERPESYQKKLRLFNSKFFDEYKSVLKKDNEDTTKEDVDKINKMFDELDLGWREFYYALQIIDKYREKVDNSRYRIDEKLPSTAGDAFLFAKITTLLGSEIRSCGEYEIGTPQERKCMFEELYRNRVADLKDLLDKDETPFSMKVMLTVRYRGASVTEDDIKEWFRVPKEMRKKVLDGLDRNTKNSMKWTLILPNFTNAVRDYID